MPSSEKTAFKKLLETDAAAATEWKVLKQARLLPDMDIVFPDKRSLYRTSGSRVIGMKWWRIAAAALLLGFGLWGGFTLYKNNTVIVKHGEGLAKKTNDQDHQIKMNEKVVPPAIDPRPNKPVARETVIAATQQNYSPKIKITNEKNKLPLAKTARIITDPGKNNVAVSGVVNTRIKPSDKLPAPLENINNNGSNKISAVNVQPIIPVQNISIANNDIGINKLKIPDEQVKRVPGNNSVEPNNSNAKNRSYWRPEWKCFMWPMFKG